MDAKQRIALYGGSFDPIHIGHITVARALLELFALDELLFIPAHVAPHKRTQSVTPALQRYAMLALATQGEPQMRVSTIELETPERPYTVETLSRLKERYGEGARLFFVMGADSWADIRTWREWERVLELTNHIVMTRPGYPLEMEHVTDEIRARVVDLRGAAVDEIKSALDDGPAPRIYITDAVQMDVSATQVRRLVNLGLFLDWPALVPQPVAEFIGKYRLYRDKA